MKRRLTELLLLLLMLQSGSLAALQGEVRFFPATDGPVWVGQELELSLELWSNGLSFSDQRFVLPEVRGAFLLQPDASTLKLTESRQGQTWQGLRYTLLLYPQRAGRLEVPAFEVSFSARGVFGTEPEAFRSRTPALEIPARLPPGADPEGLLVTTDDFLLDFDWQPVAQDEGGVQLEVGDALTLEIRREAQGVPGMVFAPLPAFEIPGLAVYADTPQVTDQMNRGVLKGLRLDRVTFICEQEGSYTIPEMKFQWWNPERETLGEKILPQLEMEVLPSTAWGSGAASEVAGDFNPWAWIAFLLVVVILAVFPGRWLTRRLFTALKLRQAQRREEEPWAFRQAIESCEKARAVQAYSAINLWLGRCEGVSRSTTLLQWAHATGDGLLLLEAGELQACITNGTAERWQGQKLARLLRVHRKRMHRRSRKADRLSPLNP